MKARTPGVHVVFSHPVAWETYVPLGPPSPYDGTPSWMHQSVQPIFQSTQVLGTNWAAPTSTLGQLGLHGKTRYNLPVLGRTGK